MRRLEQRLTNIFDDGAWDDDTADALKYTFIKGRIENIILIAQNILRLINF